jgi:Gp157 protein
VSAAKAPSAWTVGQVLAIAKATAERLASAGEAVETDESALFAALREDGADVESIIRRLARAVVESESLSEAAARRKSAIADREKRYSKRADEYRASLFAVMQALERATFADAEFTITLSRNLGGTVIITDEKKLPDGYVRTKREPDKKKIGDDLKQGVVIPGAELSQGGEPTLTIRTR